MYLYISNYFPMATFNLKENNIPMKINALSFTITRGFCLYILSFPECILVLLL